MYLVPGTIHLVYLVPGTHLVHVSSTRNHPVHVSGTRNHPVHVSGIRNHPVHVSGIRNLPVHESGTRNHPSRVSGNKDWMARLCLPPLSKIGACVQLKIRGHTPQSIVGQGRPYGWVVRIIWRKDPPNEVQAILPKLLADPKTSSKHEMYCSHIFWRPVWRQRLQLAHIQAILPRI